MMNTMCTLGKAFGRFWTARTLAGAASLAMGATLTGCEISDQDIEFATIAEVRQLQLQAEKEPKALLLIDPRSRGAYDAARIPGAVHMEFRRDMEQRGVDPRYKGYKNIVVYGNDPGSAVARGMTKRLMSVGYDDVRLFAGGLDEWRGMNYPIEGTDATVPASEPATGEPAKQQN
ncbi:MAG TPA: rhodanese-like domain-containing protein [Phycisphaerales bacterium]|nr:rhodanese-like domain-containing protein [Phycisphaerales bacterium]